MIFEVRKGRVCDSLQNAQSRLILATQEQLSTRDKVIALQDAKIENLGLISQTWEKRYDSAQELYSIDKSRMKTKLRKRGRIIFGESVGIAVLLVVFLL